MGDTIVDLLNGFIKTVGETIGNIINAIPLGSPFDAWQNVLDNDILGIINWFLPITEIIVTLEAWCLAIALWYLLSVVLRWLKAIE